MLVINRIFELLFPMWMALVNACVGFAFLKAVKVKQYRAGGILLGTGAVSFLVVNVCYALINWSDIGPVKEIVHALGPAILVVEIVFSITGSLLTLLGTIVLVRQLLSVT